MAGAQQDTGSCEHCLKSFGYRLIHNGFGDTAHVYCNKCGCTAFLSAWTNPPKEAHVKFHQRVEANVEEFLRPCECGGKFEASASPRCAHCHEILSPVAATRWIEDNAPGTAKGWRWQQDWAGLYSIVIEGRAVKDPWKQNLPAAVPDRDTAS